MTADDEPPTQKQLNTLRIKITESIRVQPAGGGETVPYIDPSHSLIDITARHNHVVFARRGCGKSLLLAEGMRTLPKDTKYVYLNCEDYKRHSFPNVLIEILDATFEEIERHFTGWFRKKKARKILVDIRSELSRLREGPDTQDATVSEKEAVSSGTKAGGSLSLPHGLSFSGEANETTSKQLELVYTIQSTKISKLDLMLPRLKSMIRDMFKIADRVHAIYILFDDYYFLAPKDQPFVMDYVHRLCKDTPLFFKITTLRHASALYLEHHGQPTGAQERHDYQSLNIEFGLSDIKKTEKFIRRVFHEYATLAEIESASLDAVFKGDGFSRLVLAGGGVPRDCLSLFLDALSSSTLPIGKDAIRDLSRVHLERRIQELKADAQVDEQPLLLRGIYAVRQFCLERKVNSFVVEEKELQENANVKTLLNKLLDYRLIHELGTAFTHKSAPGTFRGYVIDIGFYAGLRKLQGKLTELDLSSGDWREQVRSSPILKAGEAIRLWKEAPQESESKLLAAGDDEEAQ